MPLAASAPHTALAPSTARGDWAPAASRGRRLFGRASAALVDQVLSSGSQLLLFVLVAREADTTTLGAVSVAMLAHGFLLGVVRAGIGEPVLLRCRADRSATRREARRALFLGRLAGVAVWSSLVG